MHLVLHEMYISYITVSLFPNSITLPPYFLIGTSYTIINLINLISKPILSLKLNAELFLY